MKLLKKLFVGGALFASAGFLTLASAQQGGQAKPANDVLRIGYQKSSGILIILKEQGRLEEVLAPLGVKVEWTEFTSGLPLLEGLNIGSIDLSADVAEPVPLFAQAAGAQLTYLVQEAPSPAGQAIVVRDNSPIRSLADLKGKKVAFARAAGVHYLVLKAIEKGGLSASDVDLVFLQPADGRAAFERGAIDAWAIWEPHLSRIKGDRSVRVLADGEDVDVGYRRFYLASTPYSKRRPDVLEIVVDELKKTGEWIKQSPKEAAAFHGPLVGLTPELAEAANASRSYDVQLVDAKAVADQQQIADVFTAEKILPRKLDIRQNDIWKGAK